MSFTIAIVGRPNVGKSTLFNRLTKKKQALVDDTPGLTRDRREGDASIGPLNFKVIDTAGLENAETESLEELMMQQTEKAIKDANIVLLMIDGKDGVTPADEHFSSRIRKTNKATILVINKCESKKSADSIAESYSLGFGEPVAISAEHGQGMADLYNVLAEFKENKKQEDKQKEEPEEILQIALAGRPNVGKSTLFNKLLGEDRSIVAPLAGTTRDSIYVDWQFSGRNIRLVDTAGMRKKAKRTEKVEKIAVYDSLNAIAYANLVILMIDGTEGLDKQDLTLADHIIKEGRGMIIAINKWDLVEDKENTLQAINDRLEKSLSQARGIPLMTISAQKGDGVKKIIKEALKIFDVWNKRISTGKLNRWLEGATERHIPPLSQGKRVKFRYITQAKARPPTFVLFTSSNLKNLPESYLRYLTNSIREKFGLEGVPIRINLKKGENPYKK